MPPSRLVALGLAALLVVGCSGGDDDDGETSSTAVVKPTVVLAVTAADVVSPHRAKAPLDDDVRDDVVETIEELLLVTSAGPLVEGRAGAGFARLFTPDAARRAANHDREVFFDEGLPAFGELEPNEATVSLSGLAGTMDPATKLVVAKFVWDVGGSTRPGDRIVRHGELSLIPVGGDWKIGAYAIAVTRTIDDSTTTTTAESE